MTIEDLGWDLEDASVSGSRQDFKWVKRDADGTIIALENSAEWVGDLVLVKESAT